MVVPILAPMITPTACVRFRTPALTKPTTITVVAPLLWIIAVIRAPSATARSLLFVSIPRKLLILLPAVFCIPSAIIFIPYRNIPRPPRNPNTFDTSLIDISSSSSPAYCFFLLLSRRYFHHIIPVHAFSTVFKLYVKIRINSCKITKAFDIFRGILLLDLKRTG